MQDLYLIGSCTCQDPNALNQIKFEQAGPKKIGLCFHQDPIALSPDTSPNYQQGLLLPGSMVGYAANPNCQQDPLLLGIAISRPDSCRVLRTWSYQTINFKKDYYYLYYNNYYFN